MTYISYTMIIMILKIAIGSSIAIFFAQTLNLEYSLSAGVITLLTIQSTKKATLSIAKKRIIAFLFSLLYVYCCFSLFGYTIASLTIFLLIFSATCFTLKIQDGLSMCVVLMTHFYIQESLSLFWFKNTTLLMIIGTTIGILLNLYMPKNTLKIKLCQQRIEDQMKDILLAFSQYLIECSEELNLKTQFLDLNDYLNNAAKHAYQENDNILLGNSTYYIDYIEMRKKQFLILQYMYSSIQLLEALPKQANILSDLLYNISKNLHESNNVESLILTLQTHQENLQKQELPKSRFEFENRALLFNLLTQIEQFLDLKRQFISFLSKEDQITYW